MSSLITDVSWIIIQLYPYSVVSTHTGTMRRDVKELQRNAACFVAKMAAFGTVFQAVLPLMLACTTAFGTVFQAVLPLMLTCTTANRELGFAPGIARPQIPPMGWRSWNWFACDIDQTIMEKMVTAMTTAPPWATKSLHDLGYNHIGLGKHAHTGLQNARSASRLLMRTEHCTYRRY